MIRRRGAFLCLALTAGLSAAVALARPGIVRTTDGQTFEGDVSIDQANPNIVTVKVRGIPMQLERTRVAGIEYTQGFEKEFADKMAKLAPNDVAGRLALAREAMDRAEYVLARDAAEAARRIDPNSAEAVSLLDTIRGLMRLESARPATQPSAARQPAGREPAGAGAATQPQTSPAGSAAGAANVLEPADINAIRLAELRPEDRGIRIRFDRDASRRYMRYANIPPGEWTALPDTDKVQRILADGTPEMQRDVLILNDPPVMLNYRRNVQPWVLQNCATSGCHGGQNAAKFTMIVPGESDAATYTNFYLLQRYKQERKQSSDRVFGPGDLRMIDRQRPEQSLLLQYALPGAIAEHDHPDVQNYRPSVRNVTDPRYRIVLDWISSLRPVDQNYGIDLEGADGTAASQPATTQATDEASDEAAKPPRPARPTGAAAAATRPRGAAAVTRPAPRRPAAPPAR